MNASKGTPIIVGRAVVLVTAGGVDYHDLDGMLQAARNLAVPIVRFEERAAPAPKPRETGKEPVHGTHGSDYFLSKYRPSCFRGTELEILLRGLKAETLILAGSRTDVEIHYTFVDAHQHDYFVRVAEDCVLGSSPAAHDYALSAMAYLQTSARQTSSVLLEAIARGLSD